MKFISPVSPNVSLHVPPCSDPWRLGASVTWYVVSEANSGEGDDHEVERLQKRPVLHPLKHERGHGEEDQAADEDGQHRRDQTHRRRTDLTLLREERLTLNTQPKHIKHLELRWLLHNNHRLQPETDEMLNSSASV